jgi:hypothetical protein
MGASSDVVDIPTVPPRGLFDVSIEFKAPQSEGESTSRWYFITAASEPLHLDRGEDVIDENVEETEAFVITPVLTHTLGRNGSRWEEEDQTLSMSINVVHNPEPLDVEIRKARSRLSSREHRERRIEDLEGLQTLAGIPRRVWIRGHRRKRSAWRRNYTEPTLTEQEILDAKRRLVDAELREGMEAAKQGKLAFEREMARPEFDKRFALKWLEKWDAPEAVRARHEGRETYHVAGPTLWHVGRLEVGRWKKNRSHRQLMRYMRACRRAQAGLEDDGDPDNASPGVSEEEPSDDDDGGGDENSSNDKLANVIADDELADVIAEGQCACAAARAANPEQYCYDYTDSDCESDAN